MLAFGSRMQVVLLVALMCSQALRQRAHHGQPKEDNVLLQRRHTLALKSESVASEQTCHTLREGEPCYQHVLWAWVYGIVDYPDWYPAPLSRASSFEDFQAHLHTLKPTLCPVPCRAAALHSAVERCTSRAIALDFHRSVLVQNNLGGRGPDRGPKIIKYQGVGKVMRRNGDSMESRPFDLVLTAGRGYRPKNISRNGLSGEYGIVNLAARSRADVTFSFEDSATGSPVVLEAFHFSLLDIDQSSKVREQATLEGFTEYSLHPQTEVGVKDMSGGRKQFFSTKVGTGCDNPTDPLQLGKVTCKGKVVDQKKRSVTFLFKNTSSFKASFEVKSCKKKKGKEGGRNFLFAGSSSLSSSCKESPRPGLCAAFGDPHFVTFDGAHTVLLAHQLLWLVKSQTVWMQALSDSSIGKLLGFAVGGPFMGNHSLVLRKTADNSIHALFDDQIILSEPDSEFHVARVLESYRSTSWNSSLHNDDVLAVRTQMQFAVGPWPERFLQEPAGGVFLFRLPGYVEVTATGVDFMTVVITMPRAAGGQSGYCGNFNGQAEDDFEHVSASFHKPTGEDLGPVELEESLFGSDVTKQFLGEGSSVPLVTNPDVVLQECHPSIMATAQERCEHVTDVQKNAECIYDVCATGLISAADGVLSAELLENKVNARGIPVYVGAGQCIDVARRRYSSVGTRITAPEDCQDALRSLALAGMVLGAQLQSGGFCEILLDMSADVPSVPIDGGWDREKRLHADGHGIIVGTTEEQGWKCWRLV